jgi:hypothetical protein
MVAIGSLRATRPRRLSGPMLRPISEQTILKHLTKTFPFRPRQCTPLKVAHLPYLPSVSCETQCCLHSSVKVKSTLKGNVIHSASRKRLRLYRFLKIWNNCIYVINYILPIKLTSAWNLILMHDFKIMGTVANNI